jgi:ELWxxDGT repeat protein
VRVADINTAPARCAEAYEPEQFLPAALTRAGDLVYFLFDDCHTGIELWRTDGTAAGTRLVKDIFSGLSGSDIEMLGDLDGELIFVADDGGHGRELWRSDGSATGTEMIADLAPGPAGIAPSASAVAGGTLYFVTGVTLWKSDGTAEGTLALHDFPGNTFSDLTGPGSLTPFNDALYFVAPGAAGDSLWRSDGTAAGTGVVRVLGGGGCAGGPMRAGATHLFLRAFTLDAGCELWRSDGTSSGTMLVRDINPGPFGSMPEVYAMLGNRAVFAASTPQTGRELWSTDGTAIGSIPLDLDSGPASALECDLPRDVVVGGFLYFLADDGRGCELWRTDGTLQGTRLTRELVPGAADAAIEGLTAVGNLVLFSAATAGSGREPWRSDGSAGGTAMLAELVPGAGSSLPDGFAFVPVGAAGGIVFAAKNGAAASALWRSDGGAAGTAQLTDFPATGSRGSDPAGLTATQHGLLFTAADDVERGLFRADAAAPAIARLGSVGTSPAREIEIADLAGVFFYITDAPPTLWRTDGASAPSAVLEFAAGAILGDPVAIDGAVLFVVSLAGRDELWRSDGTAEGTFRVGANLTASSRPVAVGARAFFSAGPPNNIFLLSSDGTAAGTRAIVRIGTPVSDLTASGGRVFFVAAGFTEAGLPLGRELWVSDGTAAGTTLFDLDGGARSSNPGELVDVEGTLFFAAEQFFVGRELWRSDGTVSGTQMVRDITIGRRSSAPAQLVGAGGRVFFAADDGCSERALWVSNGTEAGTRPLASVVPLAIGATGDRAVFAGFEPESGDEPWLSDGTADGTGRLADIAPGAASSSPRRFTVSGDYLYFTADEGMSGEEVWALRLADLVLPTPTPSPTGSLLPTPSETPTAGATRTPARCPGDCLGDGVVAISDLITGVNIALERAALDGCANLDRDGNGRVSIDELIGALNSSLGGCPT